MAWHREDMQTINQETACAVLAEERTGRCAESLAAESFPAALAMHPDAVITGHLGMNVCGPRAEQHEGGR